MADHTWMFRVSNLEATFENYHKGKLETRRLDPYEVLSVLSGPETNTRSDTGLLPVALRWASHDFSYTVWERPPQDISIVYDATDKYSAMKRQRSQKDVFRVPMPWTVYVVNLSSYRGMPQFGMNFGLAKEPICSLDHQLYYIPLPNAVYGGAMCKAHTWNEDLAKVFTPDWSIADVGNFAINAIWTTNFNDNAGSLAQQTPDEYDGEEGPWGRWLEWWAAKSLPEALNLSWQPYVSLETLLPRRKETLTVADQVTGRALIGRRIEALVRGDGNAG